MAWFGLRPGNPSLSSRYRLMLGRASLETYRSARLGFPGLSPNPAIDYIILTHVTSVSRVFWTGTFVVSAK